MLVYRVLLVDIEVIKSKNMKKKKIFLIFFFSQGIDWFAGVKISPAGVLNLGYFHQKTNSPLQLGVEFEGSLPTRDTSATFSYQYDMLNANTTFRGMIDTNGLVTGVIEKRLAPLPFTFLLSSSLNHAKAAYRFGIGLMIG